MLRFDIHGVNVEIHGENRKLHDFLLEQLGFFSNECFKEPDVTIELVSRLATPSKLKSIGNQVIFGNGIFYAQIEGSKILFPIQNIGRKIKIKVEMSVPLEKLIKCVIEPVFYFKLLKDDFVLIHASAVQYENTGIIFPAWTHAGKTVLLIQFLQRGADFLADDWVFVSASGKIHAYPRPIWISAESRVLSFNNFLRTTL